MDVSMIVDQFNNFKKFVEALGNLFKDFPGFLKSLGSFFYNIESLAGETKGYFEVPTKAAAE
ncbi:PorH family porin [Corynebacterium sp. ES2794-CONJ1]|uniref:PorH family porin n=1 Tax=unclassified Corynebacterium TaxID=2624378 RepID=UPI0021698E34|nr:MULTISPECIES: PorH family porin [unclassified Corynebacterium]MCS4490230.1 PorH family porin [Corynebacterium sp. ES2775-CONJ]MCS4491959.1 PorH family porin [Corynebacterium sp. ES2715-CONJ3]MCS4532063.1 PorH family porin [Corynebacterium sp. ES2730-CONJ]MCU9519465.1 PorH family porin [Corynebacterium sp. ES2794-CONJ1]